MLRVTRTYRRRCPRLRSGSAPCRLRCSESLLQLLTEVDVFFVVILELDALVLYEVSCGHRVGGHRDLFMTAICCRQGTPRDLAYLVVLFDFVVVSEQGVATTERTAADVVSCSSHHLSQLFLTALFVCVRSKALWCRRYWADPEGQESERR
jgi:hypothetical protein